MVREQEEVARMCRSNSGVMVAMVVAVAMTALGCLTESRGRQLGAYETQGPGTVFPTIEMAAVDGLAYSYQ